MHRSDSYHGRRIEQHDLAVTVSAYGHTVESRKIDQDIVGDIVGRLLMPRHVIDIAVIFPQRHPVSVTARHGCICFFARCGTDDPAVIAHYQIGVDRICYKSVIAYVFFEARDASALSPVGDLGLQSVAAEECLCLAHYRVYGVLQIYIAGAHQTVQLGVFLGEDAVVEPLERSPDAVYADRNAQNRHCESYYEYFPSGSLLFQQKYLR